jgi:hypothetical protein
MPNEPQGLPIASADVYIANTPSDAQWGTMVKWGVQTGVTLASTLANRPAASQYRITGYTFEKKQSLDEREAWLAAKLQAACAARMSLSHDLEIEKAGKWIAALDKAAAIAFFILPIEGMLYKLATAAVEEALLEFAWMALDQLVFDGVPGGGEEGTLGGNLADFTVEKGVESEKTQKYFQGLAVKHFQTGRGSARLAATLAAKGIEKLFSFTLDAALGGRNPTELLFYSLGGASGLGYLAMGGAALPQFWYQQVTTFSKYRAFLALEKEYKNLETEIAAAHAFRIQIDRKAAYVYGYKLRQAAGKLPLSMPYLLPEVVSQGDEAILCNCWVEPGCDLILIPGLKTGWYIAEVTDCIDRGTVFRIPGELPPGEYGVAVAKTANLSVVYTEPPAPPMRGARLKVLPRVVIPLIKKPAFKPLPKPQLWRQE